jgi:hypothetical protein
VNKGLLVSPLLNANFIGFLVRFCGVGAIFRGKPFLTPMKRLHALGQFFKERLLRYRLLLLSRAGS